MEVRDVLRKCTDNGLEVRKETGSGHWKIHDPATGAWLFNVSSSPSDANFFWAVRRHFRRLGIPWDAAEKKSKRRLGHRQGFDRKRSAIDLYSLAKAQAAARERGEREPQLSDLDETTSSEFWKKISIGSRKTAMHTEQAMEEVIKNMAARKADARVRLVKGRLMNTLIEKASELEEYGREKAKERGGKYFPPRNTNLHIADFVRYSNDVAYERNLRPFSSEQSGFLSIRNFLKNEEGTLSLWTLELVEATVDKLQGLRWGKVEEEAPTEEKTTTAEEQLEEEIEARGDSGIEVNTPLTKIRYANALLLMLERNAINGDNIEPILVRLDKLMGIEV